MKFKLGNILCLLCIGIYNPTQAGTPHQSNSSSLLQARKHYNDGLNNRRYRNANNRNILNRVFDRVVGLLTADDETVFFYKMEFCLPGGRLYYVNYTGSGKLVDKTNDNSENPESNVKEQPNTLSTHKNTAEPANCNTQPTSVNPIEFINPQEVAETIIESNLPLDGVDIFLKMRVHILEKGESESNGDGFSVEMECARKIWQLYKKARDDKSAGTPILDGILVVCGGIIFALGITAAVKTRSAWIPPLQFAFGYVIARAFYSVVDLIFG